MQLNTFTQFSAPTAANEMASSPLAVMGVRIGHIADHAKEKVLELVGDDEVGVDAALELREELKSVILNWMLRTGQVPK